MKKFSNFASSSRALFALLAAFTFAPTVVSGGAAQLSPNSAREDARPSSPDASASARSLYEEAESYVRRKFEEFEKKQMPYDAKLAEKTKQEQREMAARHAENLLARRPLRGSDLYYLARLQAIADRPADSLGTLRRFLADGGSESGAERQQARVLYVEQAAAAKLMPEAARVMDEYLANEPRSHADVNRLGQQLAAHFYRSKEYERTATYARAAYASARHLVRDETLEPRKLDNTVFGAGSLVVNSLLRTNKRKEAVEVLHEMRALALSIPSARLYVNVAEPLRQLGESLSAVGPEAVAQSPAAPEIEVDEWIGQRRGSLAALRGRVVLLDFWATWCGPCKATIPKLSSLQRKYADAGLVVIGMTNFFGEAEGEPMTPERELEYLRQYRKTNNISYDFAVADDEKNDARYGIGSIPTAVLIDRKGRVRHVVVGVYPGSDSELTSAVKKLLDEK